MADSWSNIEQELKKFARRTCTAAAGKARDDLYKEARTAILAFYKHYPHPKYYHRHEWNFKAKEDHGEGNSFRKFYDDRHKVVYGGVELTPELLAPVYEACRRNETASGVQEVFDTVFAGFHGPAGMFYTPQTFSNIPPRMTPSPRQMLLNKRDEIVKNQKKYIAFGKKVAQKEYPIIGK